MNSKASIGERVMTVLRSSSARLFAWIVMIALLGTTITEAQFEGGRRRGGPGGFGRGPQSTALRELGYDAVVEELGLSEEQQVEIRELSETPQEDGGTMFELFGRLREAQSDEERAALGAEMQQLREAQERQIEEQLQEILSDEQSSRLEQIVMHREGPASLVRSDRAMKLNLTEEQRDQLSELSDERRSAMREFFRASPEERSEAEQEWNERLLSVLTDAQREQWTDLLGPAAPEISDEERWSGRGRGRRGGGGRGGRRPEGGGDAPQAAAVDTSPPAEVFSATAGPGAATFDASGGDSEGKMSFNFQAAPWSQVLRDFARRAGLTLEMKDTPPGTFTYFDRSEYTPREALDVLNGPLLRIGYVLVQKNEFLICANIDKGPPPNLIPYITSGQLAEHGDNELLTVVFSVKGVENIETLAKQVQEMLGPQGKAVGVEAAGALVVTDLGANLRRVDDLLRATSALLGPEDVKFQAYPLVHISATEAESLLRTVLGLKAAVKNVSGGDRSDRRSRDRSRWSFFGRGGNDDNGDNNRDQEATASPFAEGLLAKTQFAADSRINQLLVTAPAVVHVLIDSALKTIDVEATGSALSRRDTAPYLHVYEMRTGSVEEAAKTIDAILPGIVINEDGRGDRVHIMATASQHREVEEIIRKLDGEGGGQNVAVIPLSVMDPSIASSTLQQMFVKDGSSAPTIQADLMGRQVMVRGTADQISQVKILLAQLGEDGSGQRARGAGGPVRRFSLSGRDGERLLELIDQAWHATQPNRIEIVPARARGPIRGFEQPAESRREFREEERPARRTRSSDQEPVSLSLPAGASEFVALFDEDQSAETDVEERVDDADDGSEADASEPTRSSDTDLADGERREVAPGIFVQVQGDELILMSEDEEALDRLEALLEQTLLAIPASNTWTVFTLQSADATEAAAMLEQLMPDASVTEVSDTSNSGGFFGSLSSMGNSLVNATGLNAAPVGGLKIIPEVRLNALFVSGPASRVREVEDFLQVLDASDWPGTLRDRVPHMIPVQYAEIGDVYRVVRDVYSDYLQPTQGNQGGGNPFAMFTGGGRGGRDAQPAPGEVRLTVGMDEQTSHLIVSADDGLFQEVQELVASLDNAARDARRTVRVVELQNANTSAVQGTLSAVMPRVRVSTAGSRSTRSDSTSTGSSTSSPDANSQQQGPSRDQMRQFFEQRMRDRMNGGGDNGGDSGRRSFFFGGRGGGDSGRRSRFGGDSGRFGGGDRGSRRGFGGRN